MAAAAAWLASVSGRPVGAVLAQTPSAITTADIGQAGALTLTMTDQTADSDTCSFSNGSIAEHCTGFLDSPQGGTQQAVPKAGPSRAAALSPVP
jgi:hypothetical protein